MAEKLLKDYTGVTAIIMRNDLFYPGILQALSQKGLSVPKDISVIGFHDYYDIVTSAVRPVDQSIQTVLEYYTQNGKLSDRDIVFKPKLKQGHTCTAPGGQAQ